MRYYSCDSHVVEAAEIYDGLTDRFGDRAPFIAKDYNGKPGTFLVLPGDAVSGQLLDEIFVCPADGTGEYRLSTVVRAIGPASEDSVELDPLTFWVRPASSQISRVTAVSSAGERAFVVARWRAI